MVDALRKLLDSGKLLEEDCHSILRGLGNKGFDIDVHVRIPERGIHPHELGKRQPPCDIALYGRLGVHCFNFEKSSVTDSFSQNGEHLRVFTQICRLKPEKPGEGEGAFSLLDDEAVDKLYKGRMPNFLSEANPDDRLRFYEVQEQDICENDWLRLYTDFALYCYWQYNEDAFKFCLPSEINKILVETFETHTDPSLKLKSSNAIFHINFTAKSRDYISVVRRTTDGKTGHMILQISTWTNPPSSP
ncbi:BnaC08g04280D [Brassica napus]|uniref:(rape) hypothetical protein n=1 Tax=Brassica napus TaxID=3708 RepID=A0A078FXB7_BRANA|nr:unnamed protein product [Brassica napus]CDY17814.1 BnaC08g04280D [Brassica napus]